jgi:hypothetical protein
MSWFQPGSFVVWVGSGSARFNFGFLMSGLIWVMFGLGKLVRVKVELILGRADRLWFGPRVFFLLDWVIFVGALMTGWLEKVRD